MTPEVFFAQMNAKLGPAQSELARIGGAAEGHSRRLQPSGPLERKSQDEVNAIEWDDSRNK
eukprot:1335173-Pyramimonas_sp.AAC.1